VCKHKSLLPVAEVVAQTMRRSTGLQLPIVKRSMSSIYLAIDKGIADPEAYELVVYTDGVDVYGGSPVGVYYGLQTLMQMLPLV
jgi:hexosaminidase